MNTHCFKVFCAAFMLTFISAEKRLSAAPVLQITENGVTVENGALKCRLAFPVPYNAAKVKGKILEKVVSETGVTLKYEGGGQIDLSTLTEEIVLKISGMPTDTKNIYLTMRLSATVASNGKWQFDSKSGVFPAELGGFNIYQGTARSLSMAPPSGQGVAFSLPASAFQQLQDLRQFQRKEFYWQCWLPFAAETEKLSIKISEVAWEAAPTANAPASTGDTQVSPPISMPTPAAPKPSPKAEDRQKYGQMGISPQGKKTGTRILRYKDGKQAAYMLAFDDNGASHLENVIPELEKRKMVGNFYINPGSTAWKKHRADWEAAAKSPYVVLHNHTFDHTGVQTVEGFEQDLLKTSEAIYAITPHLTNPRIIGFRQPGGCPWKVSKQDMKPILAKLHLTSRPWLDGPPLSMKGGLPDVLATVDTALARGELGFVDFHGVGGDGHSVPVEWFTTLLDKLESQRENLWITDAVSWSKYHAERKNSELKVLQSDASQVRASLTCSSDPAYFDLPLTVAVEVPASWEECTVTQGAKTSQVTAGGGEVRFDALPGSDEIVIKPR